MKYINAKDLFPEDLLELIQEYTQGNYIYIPKKDGTRDKWGSKTTYSQELLMRNKHIHTKFLSGYDISKLSKEYCLSEKSIRRILYSYKKESHMVKEKIQKILLDNWNIDTEITQIYPTAWLVGNDYVIKINKNFGRMKRNITMIKALDECKIPVAIPITTVNGEDYIEYEENFYFLSKKLLGKEIIDIFEEENYLEIVKETGKIIAKLHKAFLVCEERVAFWDNSLLSEMKGWITDILEANNYKYVTKVDLIESIKELEKNYDNLPKQLIHRDIHYGNILFDNNRFSGYIDFDFSQKNIRIFDLCYFLIGLLIDHNKSKECVNKWKEIVKKLINGYESLIVLQREEKENICNVMKCIELLFVAYFIREKDEASAKSASELYYFIRENEKEISSLIL